MGHGVGVRADCAGETAIDVEVGSDSAGDEALVSGWGDSRHGI